ncbi:aspartyl protease AED3-like [Macadamia integrifolia]|uniref:aspartyl protease AED3-like n=1 Tax=Macadamia integrifolia TaxID=60698 RepID=UPI001C4F8934|nr:aspartyl protease AED3-like [Macadamia integrifolia]
MSLLNNLRWNSNSLPLPSLACFCSSNPLSPLHKKTQLKKKKKKKKEHLRSDIPVTVKLFLYRTLAQVTPYYLSRLSESPPRRVMAFTIAAPFLFFSLLITAAKASDPCPFTSSGDSELPLLHIYGKCSPFHPPTTESWTDTVIHMASKDPARLTYLSNLVASRATSAPVASGQQVLNIANYVVRVKLGTPGQLMFMVLDTSKDEAWVPCSGCTGCSSTVFSPKMSSTYTSLDCTTSECSQVRGPSCPATELSPCLFNRSYGGDSSFSATLSHDSLRLALDIIPNYAFGCINTISGGSIPPQGLLGLGRGPTSLISQASSLYNGVFSYCFPSFKSYYFSGSLKLGSAGQPQNIRTTPLLRNPHRPSLYYVNLTGISVGRVLAPVAPELLTFNSNTGAGTIIDSGTVITRFVQPVYTVIRDEFRKQIKGPISTMGAFDTCFKATIGASVPTVTLHFTGMDLMLAMENTVIHSSSGSVACLAMAAAPVNVNSVLNVIANLQQQNLRILFDLPNSRIGIARELCN